MGKFSKLFRKSRSFSTLKKNEDETWVTLQAVSSKFSYRSMSSLAKRSDDSESCNSFEDRTELMKLDSARKEKRGGGNLFGDGDATDSDDGPIPARVQVVLSEDCEQPLLYDNDGEDDSERTVNSTLSSRLGTADDLLNEDDGPTPVPENASSPFTLRREESISSGITIDASIGDASRPPTHLSISDNDEKNKKKNNEPSCILTTFRYLSCRGVPENDD